MGDLKGHALPGTLFILFGLWWTIVPLRRYLLCRRNGKRYRSSASAMIPCMCRGGQDWPVEGLVKVGGAVAGLIVEIGWHLPWPPMPIVQHATMYTFFLVSGLVDICIARGLPLPSGTDYASLGLAFCVEGLLFASHTHGRQALDVHIHHLLVYTVVATLLVLAVEARYRSSPLPSVARGYLSILHGTWFWAIGIILYGHGGETVNTAWDLDSHEAVMLATIYFSWHIGAALVVVLCLMAGMAACIPYDNVNPYMGLKTEGSTKPLKANGSLANGSLLPEECSEDEAFM